MALTSLGMAMDSIGDNCAGTSYAGSGKKTSFISVLADLVAKGSTGGFATSVAGKGNNVTYGLAQCRGDISASDCSACLADAAKQLPAVCSYQSDMPDTGAGVILVNVQAMDEPKSFKKAVGKVMGKAAAQASASSSGGLGRSKDQYTPFVTIYGLTQCTRDLAPLACAQCVSTALARFGNFCGAQQGCQINYSSCRVRYEIYPFYFPLDGVDGRATTDMTKYRKIVVHA